MAESMPALSVRQPWADLIVTGRKRIEIRSWERPYRGRLWIHASLHADEALDATFGVADPFRGGFVGSVELTSIEPFDEETWVAWRKYHLDEGPFRPGLFAWVLASPCRFAAPVRAPGRLGLFQPDAESAAQLVAAERARC